MDAFENFYSHRSRYDNAFVIQENVIDDSQMTTALPVLAQYWLMGLVCRPSMNPVLSIFTAFFVYFLVISYFM